MNIIEDVSSKIEWIDFTMHIRGLGQGNYTLYFPSLEGGLNQIQCTVIDNKTDFSKQEFWSQWLVGADMCAKQNGKVLQQPLEFEECSINSESIDIRIKNASPNAFLVATVNTFVPTYDETLVNSLLSQRSLTQPLAQANGVQSTRSLFLDDKCIGEEYQYILNRSRSEQWIGSNLTKPSLLVYPKVKYAFLFFSDSYKSFLF